MNIRALRHCYALWLTHGNGLLLRGSSFHLKSHFVAPRIQTFQRLSRECQLLSTATNPDSAVTKGLSPSSPNCASSAEKPPPSTPFPPPCTPIPSTDSEGSVEPFQARDAVSIKEEEQARQLVLSPPALVVTREYEWGNILLGFEQANKYTIRAAPHGEVVGYIAETDSVGKAFTRNMFRTHRAFEAVVLSRHGVPIFKIRRPMYLISTSLHVETPDGQLLGDVLMKWHVYRRRYELFVDKKQFASVDSGFLAVDFSMQDEQGRNLANVNKDFTGLARELFTDARQYVLRLDPSVGLTADDLINQDAEDLEEKRGAGLSMKERAVMLGCAISIDFDYFSLHSRGGGGLGMMPFVWPGSNSSGSAGSADGASDAAGSVSDPTKAHGITLEQAEMHSSAVDGNENLPVEDKDRQSDDDVGEWSPFDTGSGRHESSQEESAGQDETWSGPWQDPEDAVHNGEGIGGVIGSLFKSFSESDD